jgi:hypothetical protein
MTVLAFFFADLSAPGAVFLAVGATATISIPALLLADAHRSDFPRLRQAAVDARRDADWAAASALHLAHGAVRDARLGVRIAVSTGRHTLLDAALAAAALLAVLFPAPEATR